MTTELPSGETFTEGKLTELKNSSRVSLGFAVWAWAKIEWVKSEAEITDTRERTNIDRRIVGRALNTYSFRRDAACRISPRGERQGKPRPYGCGVSWSRRFRIAQRLIQR